LILETYRTEKRTQFTYLQGRNLSKPSIFEEKRRKILYTSRNPDPALSKKEKIGVLLFPSCIAEKK